MPLVIIGSKVGQGEITRNTQGYDSARLVLNARAPKEYWQPDVIEDPACPQVGDGWNWAGQEIAELLVTEVQARRVPNSLTHWEITVTYSNAAEGEGDGGGDQNPLLAPPEISYTSEQVQFTSYKDLDGKPFCNSAGEKFANPPQFSVNNRILTYSRNQAARPSLDAWIGACNSDPFQGYAAGTCVCRDIPISKAYWKGLGYWKVTFVIAMTAYNQEKHWELDAGSYYWSDTGSLSEELTKVYPRDKKGTASTAPVLLNGEGGALKEDGGPPNMEEAKYIEFRMRPKKAFSVFNISV